MMTAITGLENQSVVCQMEYHPAGRPTRGGPFCRIEWRPLAAHSNKNIGPLEFRFTQITGSHHHRFDLNWNHSQSQVRKGNLRIAVPIDPDPPTYEDLLAFVGREFRIKGMEEIPVPPWQGQML